MKRKFLAGTTSLTLPVFVADSSSTTGAGLAITHASSGLVFEYRRQGQSSWTSVTPVSATLGTFTSGGVVADGALTGAIEIGVPDAAIAAGARFCVVRLRGVANMLPVLIELELDAVNYQDAAGFGLSRIDQTIGSRATQTSVDAIDDFIDTEVAAIKAKTDSLPSDPADASDIAAAFVTVNSKLDAIDDYIDSEIAAIKAVTDKYDTMIVLDTSVYQFTVNALENAPSGGGGSTDWTGSERTAIRAILGIPSSGTTPVDPTSGILDTIRDAIGVVDGVVDDILVDTGTTIPGLISTVDSQVDAIESTVGAIETKVDLVDSNVDTLLVRITSTLFSGITSLADWIRRIARKDAGTAGMIAAESEIDTGGTSTFNGTADSLEAIRDAGGGGGGGGDPWDTDLVAGGYTGDEAGNVLLQVLAKANLITTSTVFVDADSNGSTISLWYNEARTVAVPLDEDTTSKTLELAIESADGTDLQTVANASINRTATQFSWSVTTAVTGVVGNHQWSLRDITGGIDRIVSQGVLSVSYAASNDA